MMVPEFPRVRKLPQIFLFLNLLASMDQLELFLWSIKKVELVRQPAPLI
jgi:hypothetical protein